ncbi:peptidoglycan -binding protein [Pseudomarimonas salicorniae]|uniref:Peptidoglycan -binding protein n=1 Tax=Pseudomarimonas salicorniae TaxID=2933270 RepID=A0ABT0GGN0_9GAMM|nr:peptidoglycan -binding protein [Lysobacter sp. CAU 1642]MCK7593507.1 peptidoglycan -binding protein [Lysobacter sp. CAU 1642]
MSTLAARRRRPVDFWPGFVDALSSLLMVLVFLLLVFTIGQFVLSDALSGRDKALARLNAELAQLAEVLSMEREAKAGALRQVEELSASLASASSERDALRLRLDETSAALTQTQAQLESSQGEVARLVADIAALSELKQQLEAEIASRLADLEQTREKLTVQTELSAKSAAQVELLNRQMAALRQQLDEISAALELQRAASKAKDQQIEDLGRQLNLALADKVNELARYRSNFFGKLREILGNRDDIVVVGDRFVVPSELLFPSGSDELGPEGRRQLDRIAQTLREVTAEIPSSIDWVLRIDGHTDRRPINTPRFPSNWELSSARAIAIVKHLVTAGIPPKHLAANGFGQFQPLDPGDSEAALARNRRIEIQLTNR